MAAYWTALCAGITAVTVFLVFRVKKKLLQAAMTKAVASLLFILTALAASYVTLSRIAAENGIDGSFGEALRYACFICGGLVCGLLGDIWLDLKYCYREDDRPLTYAGFISFAAGHVFYTAALISLYGLPLLNALISVGIAAAVALVIYFGEKVMKLMYGEFKPISALYGFVMFTMMLFAQSFCIFRNGAPLPVCALVMTVGGIFFIISDFIRSGTYFGVGRDRSGDIIANHVTYYTAQFIIASSVLFIRL